MAENTAISWADDTFNPWEGCQKVSPGCDGCYAEARNARYAGQDGAAPNWGPGAPRRRTSPANWAKPLKWEKEQAAFVERWRRSELTPPPARFVFCASLADVFDNAVPAEWRRDLFDLIRETPHLTWLLLTKRPGNIVKLYTDVHEDWRDGSVRRWPRNAAIGFTAVTQPEMDRDAHRALEAFIALGAPFLFWSGEPLLSGVVIPDVLLALGSCFWAITGGETDQGAHKARPSHPDWFRSLRDQCAAAGVPFHFKQWGEWAPIWPDLIPIPRERQGWVHIDTGKLVQACIEADLDVLEREERKADRLLYGHVARVGKKAAGRTLDGVIHDARPQVRP